MENYGDKAVYWYRREAVEKFLSDIGKAIPRAEERHQELIELNRQLKVIHDTTFFKCVYLFRAGQTLTTRDHGEGRGYSDVWWRSCHWSLDVSPDYEEKSNTVPMPGEPLEIELQAVYRGRGYLNEFVQCWHPNCVSAYKEHPTGRHNHPVTYLLCKGHADPTTVKVIHDYCMFGTPIVGPEISKMVEAVRAIITARISDSLDQSKAPKKIFWKNRLRTKSSESSVIPC